MIQYSMLSHKRVMNELMPIRGLPVAVLEIIAGYVAPDIRLAFCKQNEVVFQHLETNVQERRNIERGRWVGLLSDNVVCVRERAPMNYHTWLDAVTLKKISSSAMGERIFDAALRVGEGEQARWLQCEVTGERITGPVTFCSLGPNRITPQTYRSTVVPQELVDGRIIMCNDDGEGFWKCHFCKSNLRCTQDHCYGCSHSRLESVQAKLPKGEANWSCEVCEQKSINFQLSVCPRCHTFRARNRDVRICLYEVSPSRDKLVLASSWLCGDSRIEAIALFPSHVACANETGFIRIWTLPRAKPAQLLQKEEKEEKEEAKYDSKDKDKKSKKSKSKNANNQEKEGEEDDDDKPRLIQKWQAAAEDFSQFSMAALPGGRLAVGSLNNIVIHDIESGEAIRTIPEGGTGLCALPDVDFFTSQAA